MDAVGLDASARTPALAQASFSIGVLRKAMDLDKLQGEMLVRLMDAQAGLGTTLDTQA